MKTKFFKVAMKRFKNMMKNETRSQKPCGQTTSRFVGSEDKMLMIHLMVMWILKLKITWIMKNRRKFHFKKTIATTENKYKIIQLFSSTVVQEDQENSTKKSVIRVQHFLKPIVSEFIIIKCNIYFRLINVFHKFSDEFSLLGSQESIIACL